jgi:hypothetical protein
MAECRSLRLACLNGLAPVLFLFSACAHAFEPERACAAAASRDTCFFEGLDHARRGARCLGDAVGFEVIAASSGEAAGQRGELVCAGSSVLVGHLLEGSQFNGSSHWQPQKSDPVPQGAMQAPGPLDQRRQASADSMPVAGSRTLQDGRGVCSRRVLRAPYGQPPSCIGRSGVDEPTGPNPERSRQSLRRRDCNVQPLVAGKCTDNVVVLGGCRA